MPKPLFEHVRSDEELYHYLSYDTSVFGISIEVNYGSRQKYNPLVPINDKLRIPRALAVFSFQGPSQADEQLIISK